MAAPHTDRRRALGAAGERLAEQFLQARGYRITARNVRLTRGEIDLVAEHDGATVLIEVRLRRGAGASAALESVSRLKQRRLRLLAAEYSAQQVQVPTALRIDVVAVSLNRDGRLREIRLVQNAVEDESGY